MDRLRNSRRCFGARQLQFGLQTCKLRHLNSLVFHENVVILIQRWQDEDGMHADGTVEQEYHLHQKVSILDKPLDASRKHKHDSTLYCYLLKTTQLNTLQQDLHAPLISPPS